MDSIRLTISGILLDVVVTERGGGGGGVKPLQKPLRRRKLLATYGGLCAYNSVSESSLLG